MNPTVGQQAPDFEAASSDGTRWSLAAHRGQPVVLYFYPKDETPGCTTQACVVRDNWSRFAAFDAEVVGISPDDLASHEAFRANHTLPQQLLVDTDHEIMRAYGAWGKKIKDGREVEGVIRSSVVISATGDVLAVYSPIDPADQADTVLSMLAELGG